jgi:homoserine kinase type II
MKQEKNYMDEILVHFFPSDSWKTEAGQSGANNTTRFITVNDEQFVLRIYETHRDEEKVEYEHSVLLALTELPLTFSIPEPIQTQKGKTIVRAKDGKIAGLFRYLDGVNPSLNKLTELHSFGRTAGLLTKSLGKIQINQPSAYRPYYEIESTHPRCSLSDVMNFCINPPIEFAELTAELHVISEQLTSFQEIVPSLKHLPHQLVHGDLNASNILVNCDGIVSAILDFEFVTNDLRVMEPAVCLSDFIHPDQDETIVWAKIDAFLSGYGSSIKLWEDEINVLPVLIQLRSLDVFLHFLGRYWDKINSNDIVKKYVQKTVIRRNWLIANEDKLNTLCIQHLLAQH